LVVSLISLSNRNLLQKEAFHLQLKLNMGTMITTNKNFNKLNKFNLYHLCINITARRSIN